MPSFSREIAYRGHQHTRVVKPPSGQGLVNMEEKMLLWWEENEILVLSRLFYTEACLASIGLKGKTEFMLFYLHIFWKAMFEPKESN